MSSMLNIEKLKGRENYSIWKIGARAHLTTKDYSTCIDNELAADASEALKTKDAKAFAEIILMVDTNVYTHLQGCLTAKEGWDTLSSAFEDKGVVRKVTLLKQLVSLKLNECESMQAYVEKCLSLHSKVKAAGFDIDDQIAGSMMLCGLSDDFKPMIMSIESSEKDISIDYVKNILLQEVDFEKSEEKALITKQKKNKNFKKKAIKCYECNGPHFKNKCPRLKQKKDDGGCNVALYSSFTTNNDSMNVALYNSFVASDDSKDDWFIDSGATAHMTKNELSLSYETKPMVNEIKIANNQRIKIKSVGDVELIVKKNNGNGKVRLKNKECTVRTRLVCKFIIGEPDG